MRPKLATDLPEPPPITPEVRRQLEIEAREWGKEFQKRIREMELSPEDWRVIVR